ncbi:hypothetical protein OUZ56_012654 [Daphnia magna]|uniref:Uncharacterized protein n=1 Tax=Daphnia magna TaxID=35525 RepID=A0ABQ9Z3N2_9CRUS|nr:hypothetical protein OUZ56_012654 [Daphnia magna]
MEKEISTLEVQQHINKIGKIEMANELCIKQALIDTQAEELSKILLEFAEKCKEAEENNEEKFKKIMVGKALLLE